MVHENFRPDDFPRTLAYDVAVHVDLHHQGQHDLRLSSFTILWSARFQVNFIKKTQWHLDELLLGELLHDVDHLSWSYQFLDSRVRNLPQIHRL